METIEAVSYFACRRPRMTSIYNNFCREYVQYWALGPSFGQNGSMRWPVLRETVHHPAVWSYKVDIDG